MLVGLVSSIYLLVVTPTFGLPGVWSGLFLFMMLRLVAGVWRYHLILLKFFVIKHLLIGCVAC